VNTKLVSLLSFFEIAAPIPTDKPWPKEPEAIRIPGNFLSVEGCPCKRDDRRLNVANSETGKYPDRAKTLYQTGDIWPFDKKNKSSSFPSIEKFSALIRSFSK